MKKQQLKRLTGSLDQVAYIRDVEFERGRAKGLGAWEVKNGPLFMRILKDKCLDIEEVSYKGVGFNFLAKTGVLAPDAGAVGADAQRSIMGGFMFTAGLENICAPCTVDGMDFPMHGRMRSTPACLTGADAKWDGDVYHMELHGEMREAELFGENMVLRRRIETYYGDRTFTVTDEVENQSLRPEVLMLLYHINLGYPLLDEGTVLIAPTLEVIPRDEAARPHVDNWNIMSAPIDNEAEYVYLHRLAARPDGQTVVCVCNERLGLGVRLEFSHTLLPYFMEWKSMASGDYALGLEPANASVYGRAYHAANGTLSALDPLEAETRVLRFTILDGADEIENARREVKKIQDQ